MTVIIIFQFKTEQLPEISLALDKQNINVLLEKKFQQSSLMYTNPYMNIYKCIFHTLYTCRRNTSHIHIMKYLKKSKRSWPFFQVDLLRHQAFMKN